MSTQLSAQNLSRIKTNTTAPVMAFVISAIAFGLPLGFASSWMGFAKVYVAAGVVFGGFVGLGVWRRHIHFRIAFACFGAILQPAMFHATMCDGQVFMWPMFGGIVGLCLGQIIDVIRRRRFASNDV